MRRDEESKEREEEEGVRARMRNTEAAPKAKEVEQHAMFRRRPPLCAN